MDLQYDYSYCYNTYLKPSQYELNVLSVNLTLSKVVDQSIQLLGLRQHILSVTMDGLAGPQRWGMLQRFKFVRIAWPYHCGTTTKDGSI